MTDLIERLRLNQGEIFGPTMQEAADELERLTKERDAFHKAYMELANPNKPMLFDTTFPDTIDRLQRENEEVMRQKAYQYQRAKKAEEELAALKASTEQWSHTMRQKKEWADEKDAEPVAWRTFDGEGGYDLRNYTDNEYYKEWYATYNPKYPHWCEPLYLAPPQATALLESLGDWVYERMQQADADYHNYGDDTAEVYATLKMVLSKIESMIEGENHGRHE